MAQKFAQIETMARPELVALFDKSTEHTHFGAGFWREEIFRYDFKGQNETLLRLTRHIRTMTAAITVLTLVNVLAVVLVSLAASR